jgi:hypothetical protein
VAESVGSQLFYRAEPIFVSRSCRAASGFPEFVREGRNLSVPECDDAMSGRSRLTVFVSFRGVLDLLP